MPEPRVLPLVRSEGEIECARAARGDRRSRSVVAAAGALAVAVLVAGLFWDPPPRLVWNASASAPVGLYAVAPAARFAVGDMVVAWTPEAARTLAANRYYLPYNVPLVKRVAAAAGDEICAAGEAVWIGGRYAARRRHADAAGRPMPAWTGCRDLGDGEFLLLMDHPDSFDGRYFGVTRGEDIIGRAALLWAG